MNEEDQTIDATDDAIVLAEEAGIDLATIEGTGKEGRIGKGDVQKAIKAAETPEDEIDADDEPDESPTAKKGTVIANFRENGDNYKIGDTYEGKEAKERRKQGLIA